MKYVRRVRALHLWLGIILAIFILVEAVTGLIQAEPWLIGADEAQLHDNHGSFAHFTNALHEGKIGSFTCKWIIDATALGLIVLTLTGIYLAWPLLRHKTGVKS